MAWYPIHHPVEHAAMSGTIRGSGFLKEHFGELSQHVELLDRAVAATCQNALTGFGVLVRRRRTN